MNSSAKKYLFYCLITLLSGCKASDQFEGFSYDPPGVTVTTDKMISPQHRRTIGINKTGIWVSNEFEGARLNDFYRVNDTLYRAVIKPENYPINNSPWYAFKVWADTAKQVWLELTYEHGDHRYYPEISRNGRNWTSIDSSAYRPDTLSGTARIRLTLGPETLWVSGQEIITGQDIHQWMNEMAAHAFITFDTVGYSHQNRPIEKMTVTEADEDQERGVVLITSRLHPPEVTGSLACAAFIERIAGNSGLAGRFRQRFEVIAFPLANPDGTNNGHWRHNAAGVDLNRDWSDFNQPETRAIRDHLLATVKPDSLRTVYYGIDFHSTNEDILYPINKEIETFPDDFTFTLLDSLLPAFPEINFKVEPFDTTSPIVKNWIFHTFGADALTYEVNDDAGREKLKAVARKAADLMMEMLLEEQQAFRNE